VGRLVDQKQPLQLIRTFADVVQERSDYILTCIGDGELRNDCELLIDSLEVTGSIFMVGYKDNPFEAIEDGSIFILNSLYEGQGIVLLEAMSRGLICIAPDCGGVCDVINDGVNGFLFRTSDVADLKRTIHKVFSMEISYLNAVRRNAYAGVISCYSPEKMADSYMNIYQRYCRHEI
jgi:UDP-D-galactose:(glucosyl)LPS alpha-1,6-D-galactosyltransferase